MTRVAVAVALLLTCAACGGSSTAKRPAGDPGPFAVSVLDRIVHNRYADAWADLDPVDQKVASKTEYVGCESRSPVLTRPRTVRIVSVGDESVGLGDGSFVDSKAVALRLEFAGGFHLVHTVHLVASGGRWTWILPSWRYRDYKADRCPTDAGSTPPAAA
jgi:hypothetical protein